MPRLTLLNLHCIETEDYAGSDEPLIKVHALGYHQITRDSIQNGDTWDISQTFAFLNKVRVELYDRDSPDGDDHLGTAVIRDDADRATPLTASFTEDGANYVLTYRVDD